MAEASKHLASKNGAGFAAPFSFLFNALKRFDHLDFVALEGIEGIDAQSDNEGKDEGENEGKRVDVIDVMDKLNFVESKYPLMEWDASE